MRRWICVGAMGTLWLSGDASAARRRQAARAPAAPLIVRVGEADGSSADVRDVVRDFGFTMVTPPQAVGHFRLPDTHGSPQGPDSFAGQWFLLNFMATWCGPCAQEMPSLQQLSRMAPVLLVASQSPDDLGAYAQRLRIRMPLVHDADDSLSAQFGVNKFPTTFLVNPAGQVVAVAVGGRDWKKTEAMFRRLARLR